jgi:hypothetical protein
VVNPTIPIVCKNELPRVKAHERPTDRLPESRSITMPWGTANNLVERR